MKAIDAADMAYHNGYDQGYKDGFNDALEQVKKILDNTKSDKEEEK